MIRKTSASPRPDNSEGLGDSGGAEGSDNPAGTDSASTSTSSTNEMQGSQFDRAEATANTTDTTGARQDQSVTASSLNVKSNAGQSVVETEPHGFISVDLSGRTAVVTGGAGGIGAAAARALAASGAHVIVADLIGQDTDGTVDDIHELGGSAEVWDVDLRDHELLAEMTLDCDILVNCAGSQVIAHIEDYEPADWDRIIDTMLTAPFLLTRAALPHMYEEEWGRIVNVCSVHGLRGSEGRVAYTSAMHGLEGLTKVTAIEGGPHGVTANCVNPGFTRTAQVQKQIRQQAALHWLPEDEVVEKVLLNRNSIKEMATVDEVAAQIIWLCSDYARLITGSSLSIDGGATAS